MTLHSIEMKVKIQDLKENPGILPFKLGISKIKMASHTFLYYINIPPIINQLNNINTLYNNTKTIIENAPITYKIALKNFHIHLDYELNTVNQKVYFLESTERHKRGLINSLGSIVKFFTGNLDYEDGVEIHKNLEKLESSQNNIIKKANMQLSITKNMMNHLNNTLSIIIRN